MEQPICQHKPSCPAPRCERAVEAAEGLPGSCPGKPRGKPCPGTFHVIMEHTEELPTCCPSRQHGSGFCSTEHSSLPTRENTDGQLGKGGPNTPSNAHASLAPGSSTAPAPPGRVVGTEGRDVAKMPRQLPCSKDCVATIPSQQHGLHMQPAHPGLQVQQVLPLSHRKPQLLLTCGSPGSTPGCKGCISSPRLELKSLLGNSGPVLFLPPGSPVQSPKAW